MSMLITCCVQRASSEPHAVNTVCPSLMPGSSSCSLIASSQSGLSKAQPIPGAGNGCVYLQ